MKLTINGLKVKINVNTLIIEEKRFPFEEGELSKETELIEGLKKVELKSQPNGLKKKILNQVFKFIKWSVLKLGWIVRWNYLS
uniref:Uncharacterized protein n=1 Tax=Candidatus Kentrum sp. TUN TaxID=2126343 RepID=A0A450Z9J1_9GAMM|nr:MAG: hypothetical protein BECKTUN1418E_GA0071001_100323 [Candidatus Kentron sp. TUN]VFK51706.1 MAG: hypothetical protein BECKTUN1418F_GA0071002_100323 [Candidatus Kentron sp. TUN]